MSKILDILYLTYPPMNNNARTSADPGADSQFRWPQPGELWSLWDMIGSIQASQVALVGEAIKELSNLYEDSFWQDGRDADLAAVKANFDFLHGIMRLFEEDAISNSLAKLKDDPPRDHELCFFILDQIEDALNRKHLMILDKPVSDLLYLRHAFGEEVSRSFPSSEPEISDAGSCIALGQYTAAVCHLMRALEPALTALAAEFGVDFRANWNSALDDTEKSIRSRDNANKRPNWDAEKDFYIDAATHFFHVKNAWRNYTMHLRRRYSRDEALEVYHDVRRFMQKIATKLHE